MIEFMLSVSKVALVAFLTAKCVTLFLAKRTLLDTTRSFQLEDHMPLDATAFRNFVWNMLCTGPPKTTLTFVRAWNAQGDIPDCTLQELINCLHEFEHTGFAITDGYRWYLSNQGIAYRDSQRRHTT